jgi:hypothetical protein
MATQAFGSGGVPPFALVLILNKVREPYRELTIQVEQGSLAALGMF